ncbi:MAG: cob(I)yrinic acid a,c-diamide adenosyltransferase [Rhodocyclaceae bacterium]|nr:cob(I)yrinic acid a,c-diamide adenosyltransferase [Rhodocyclaceae bacterium]
MGYRLSKITTRTGDTGETGLGDGSRLPKDAPRIATMGAIDELNSWLGLILSEELPLPVRQILLRIQHDLFDLGGELAMPGHAFLQENQVTLLEADLSHLNAELPPLKEFILPGGVRAAALCHLARTVCRRAERHLVALGREEVVSAASRRYLNRLSDLLFVLARWLNKAAGASDVLWQKGARS